MSGHWGFRLQRTKWGGIADDCFRGSGFFRVDERNGVFWLVDPDGGRFLSKGVNTVRFDQDHVGNTDRVPYADACRKKYGSRTSGALRQQTGWRAGNSTRSAAGPMNLSPAQDRRCLRPLLWPHLVPLSGCTGATRSFPMSLIPHFRVTSAQAQKIIAPSGATSRDCSAHLSTTNCTGRRIGEGPTNF